MHIGASYFKVISFKKKAVHKLYKFTPYENTKQEQIPFCTPETTNFIDCYLIGGEGLAKS
jgi:hypothetical protein